MKIRVVVTDDSGGPVDDTTFEVGTGDLAKRFARPLQVGKAKVTGYEMRLDVEVSLKSADGAEPAVKEALARGYKNVMGVEPPK